MSIFVIFFSKHAESRLMFLSVVEKTNELTQLNYYKNSRKTPKSTNPCTEFKADCSEYVISFEFYY